MDSNETKICPACNGIMVEGVCTNCGTKASGSKAEIKDAKLHGDTIAEATPSMSDQVMGEDLGEDKTDEDGPLQK